MKFNALRDMIAAYLPDRRSQLALVSASNAASQNVYAPAGMRVSRVELNQQVILFGAANPLGSNPLALGEECTEVERELKLTSYRDQFRLEPRFALTIDEFMRHLTELQPSVCHFSGHGRRAAGLVFQDEHRRPQLISGRALAMMIGAAAPSVRVVVLNACYSAELAGALRGTVDCVIGMDGAVDEAAARGFAVRLYSAIGNGRSIGNAVSHGVAALAAKQRGQEELPRCVIRDGITADDIVLAHGRL